MKNIKLIIEYNGTAYSGWQKQLRRRTVQGEIENSITEITKEKTIVNGSGRTDSGVHALGQVANFQTSSNLTTCQFKKALNSCLPNDVAVIEVKEVSDNFHSQFSSKSKIYLYKILNRDYKSAHEYEKSWNIKQKLNIESMKQASQCLIGQHDFKVFAHHDIKVKSTVRTVKKLSIRRKQDMISLEIEADGFLKRMVRMITGTLTQVGKERITPDSFKQILADGKRNKYVYTAPAHGLFLKKVKY